LVVWANVFQLVKNGLFWRLLAALVNVHKFVNAGLFHENGAFWLFLAKLVNLIRTACFG